LSNGVTAIGGAELKGSAGGEDADRGGVFRDELADRRRSHLPRRWNLRGAMPPGCASPIWPRSCRATSIGRRVPAQSASKSWRPFN